MSHSWVASFPKQNANMGLIEMTDEVRQRSILAGQKLINAAPGEEIVISGVSGSFPDSDDVREFASNLYGKVDLVSGDFRRWDATHPEIPQRTGKINNVEKFDAAFFGVHPKQANAMDPMCRILLEKTIEAVMDAGMNPKELEGTNTGVFIGACFSESEKSLFYDLHIPQSYGIMGCTRSMLAQRISYWLKLKGPSYLSDTACSSSLFSFERAYRSLREGKCSTAIVGGCNLCLHPLVSLQFARLGVLSPDGACKSFDESANGYARSEGICAIVLQKSIDAKRIYAEVLHSKTNCDGFKEQGITYPSGKVQRVLLDEFYEECGVPPSSLSYVEAHGTGTKVGDPEELGTLDVVFCKDRTTPLLIGSVKSNIGHNEPSSGLCSVIKVIIGMENDMIPPNINYKTPRSGIAAFSEGRLKVVADKTPVPEGNGLFGINSFGFGGANSHLLLRRNCKLSNDKIKDSTPRLVCIGGRSEKIVNNFFDELNKIKLNADFIGLLQESFKYQIAGYLFRGYAIITDEGIQQKCLTYYDGAPTAVKCKFASANGIFRIDELLQFPIFAQFVQKCQNEIVSNKFPFQLEKILYAFNENDKVHTVLTSVIIQLGIYELFKAINLGLHSVIGNGLGKLTQMYVLNKMSLQQTLLTAYYIAKSSKNTDTFAPNLLIPILGEDLTEKLSQEIFNGISSNNQHLFEFQIENDVIYGNSSISGILEALGSVYNRGANFNAAKLYSRIEWPVARGTPMISPLIHWDHSKDWFVTVYKAKDRTKTGHRNIEVGLNDDTWQFIKGHVIDGRLLFPATGYLNLVWETLSMMTGKITSDMNVIFTDVKFIRACQIPNRGKLIFLIIIQKGSGNFEIVEGGSVVVTGRIVEGNENEDWNKLATTMDNSNEIKLSHRDIYKELRLRGYNYKGEFRALQECNLDASIGSIIWTGNWITFMDNMMQMQILQEDTRILYVPTKIDFVQVDGKKHISYAHMFKKDKCVVPVYLYKDLNIIRSGAIEIRGLSASGIARRKQAEPVLENYRFVSNEVEMDLKDSVRIAVQLALENKYTIKVKVVENCDQKIVPISPIILSTLRDQPLIQPEIFLTNCVEDFEEGINIDDRVFGSELDCYLVVANNALQKSKLMKTALKMLLPTGFIISRESLANKIDSIPDGLSVIAIYTTPFERLVLMKQSKIWSYQHCINVDDDLEWLSKVQMCLKLDQNIVLVSEDARSGILGMVNCLRREPGMEDRVRCVFMMSGKVNYQEQLKKGLGINVWKDNSWGTYKHFALEETNYVCHEHCFVNVLVRGDLSSLRWIEGPLESGMELEPDQLLVHNYCCAINFRDIMTATGRIQNDVITRNRLEQECVQGFEFSGVDSNGRRVMGMVPFNALSTLIAADVHLIWTIPDRWSFEDAVTVPTVYGTVIYAFLMRARLRRGQSVLIHSGSGGVGMAAINLCLAWDCDIFVTVGTQKKRDFIRKNFPQISDDHIGCSRDTTFEQMVFKGTKGRGVDLVLNSLADEKLSASVRCLAPGGQFLEIGKFDLVNNTRLSESVVAKGCSFHGIMLDALFISSSQIKATLSNLLAKGIDDGWIKALPHTIFSSCEIEAAFRYMSTGKHTGKVLIKIRDDLKQNRFMATPRYSCNPDYSYVIIGGLGGIGLELADWLVLRGARKLVLSSRNGPKTGYQALRIRIWKSYGVSVITSTENVSNEMGVARLLEESNHLGPVGAIFNLAVCLNDALIENQSEDSFIAAEMPKGTVTKYMDVMSRKLCPKLHDFVVFSSVTCGRGNAGQTNYGWANSIMERICEERRKSGYPALAIQWGAIGDVGVIAEKQESNQEIVICGTLQQKISSCLEVLDRLMRSRATIVESMVVAEKCSSASGADNIVDNVVNIMGIRDLKTVSLHSTLPELGMDSMMAVEIKQTLEREYDVILAPQDIRSMTFARLKEIAMEKTCEGTLSEVTHRVNLLLRFIPDEENNKIPLVTLPSESALYGTVFMLPGIEGMCSIYEPMARLLNAKTYGLQFSYQGNNNTIQDIAQSLIPIMKEQLKPNEPFTVIAYSLGGVVALEIISILEKTHQVNLILLDGSPAFMKYIIEQNMIITPDSEFETSLICILLSVYLPVDKIAEVRNELLKCKDFAARVQLAVDITPKGLPHTKKYLKSVCIASYARLKAVYNYKTSFDKLITPVTLFRPTNSVDFDIAKDYGLSKHIAENVKVEFFKGDHASILENVDMVKAINSILEFGLKTENVVLGKDGDGMESDEFRMAKQTIA
ncbi:PREDICTED: fatty acid synthase-like [Nicrophorus vespilloides]|uniref:Fatty acid synthase-like n=1 Tax=Nicrophorus vespilloides TaxID=110193 RepID=A0ABM1MAH1_NICVS|nr:PREDICTED: fatty acid synthase-like [Nicrophorus vespilloides]